MVECKGVDWLDFPSFRYCKIHKCKFSLSSFCKYQNPLITDGNVKTESVKSKKFHEQSRTITNKSRRVIVERFHSYRVKFVADVVWDHLFQFQEFSLNNNVKFKRIDYDEAIVKVFRKSILITLRSNQEIKGLPFKEAKAKSNLLIESVLKKLPLAIKIKEGKVASVHNAFVNHPTATHNVTVKVNDEVRLISDNSKGNPEFEAVNTEFAESDSEILEKFNKDLIVNNPSLPSIQDKKLNFVVDVLNEYALNMKKHVEVMDKISIGIDNLNDSIKSNAHHRSRVRFDSSDYAVLPATVSKSLRINRLKKKWGW